MSLSKLKNELFRHYPVHTYTVLCFSVCSMSGGHLLRWRFGTWTKTLGGLLGGSLWGLAQGSRYRWSIAFDNDSQERVRLSHGAKHKGCWNFLLCFWGQKQFERTWEFNFKGGKLCLQIIVLQYFRLSVSSGRVGLYQATSLQYLKR